MSDELLADRVRKVLADEPDLDEKAMFGGRAFLVAGNLAVSASGQGGLMVRVDPAASAALVEEPGVSPMVMRGRELHGWLRVETAAVADAVALRRWVGRGVGYARSLPAKRPGPSRSAR